jgi:hypothetical protein
MNIVHAQFNNIKLIGNFQFWSNPQQAESEKAIPVVLSRPTLIDLIRLSNKFGSAHLVKVNDEMFNAGSLPLSPYRRNIRRLSVIGKAQA